MRKTIKNHADFAITPDDLSGLSSFFIVRAKHTLFPNDARYGLVATKRTFRHAVDRNRAKRLLRDWIRFHADMMLPDMDYVFVARAPILKASREEGRTAMRKALHWIQKTYQNEKSEK